MKRTKPLARVLAPLTLAAIVLTACGESSTASTSTIVVAPLVVVTAVKDDPKSELLAAVYARVLEDAGFHVSRKDPVSLDRAGYYATLQAGDFQLIPEFSGELLDFVYDQPGAPVSPTTLVPVAPASTEAPITIPPTSTVASLTNTTLAGDTGTTDSGTTDSSTTDPSTTDPSTTAAPSTTVATGDTSTLDTGTTVPAPISTGRSVVEQLVAIRAALPPTLDVSNGIMAEVKLVIACTPAAMKANDAAQLITLTNLASVAPNIRLGGSAEFMSATDQGMAALTNYYGGEFKSTVTVEEADMAAAVDNDEADCFTLDSMNPVITTKRMTVLIDDKVMVVSNSAMALLAKAVATPDLVAALDTLAGSLTTERLNQMLNEVVANGTDPVVVANAFMDSI